MSSTNRGGKRTEADQYPSPLWTARRLLEDPYAREDLLSCGHNWLEPGAGSGNLIRGANEMIAGLTWTAVEIMPEYKDSLEALAPGRTHIQSYLDWSPTERYSVAFGNPPYWLAPEFLKLALEHAMSVAFLLRVNYYASASRQSFMREFPADLYILPNRPSFRGAGTDSPEYAWFVWPAQRQRAYGRVRVLEKTPLAERKLEMGPPLEGARELKAAQEELVDEVVEVAS